MEFAFKVICDRLPGSLPKTSNEARWDEVANALSYSPVWYSRSSIDYQLAYQVGNGGSWNDLSAIIYWDNRPAAIWPLSISQKDGKTQLSSHGLPLLGPHFTPTTAEVTKKKIVRACLGTLRQLSAENGSLEIDSMENQLQSSTISEWHKQWMENSAVPSLKHNLFVDLKLDWSTIRSSFRKSYKPLISNAQILWNVHVLKTANPAVWQTFQQLHLDVAGRKTRSQESWDLQGRDIANGKAIFVYLTDKSDRMIGGGLFQMTRDEAVYAVAAFDRQLFDKPIGHLVQAAAIQELKSLGIKWYNIGIRPYPADSPIPTDKEISIGDFKQGFATHMFPQIHLKLKWRGA